MTTAEAAFMVDARPILKALRQLKRGDFTARMPLDLTGVDGEIADAFNSVADLDELLVSELQKLSTVVGREGKITYRATLGDAGGSWAAAIDSINGLVGDLVRPTTEVARVIGSVANGDLTQSMALEIEGGPLKGEFLRTAKTINRMVSQLSSFASEVTRVAREVGTEGKLGGQAQVIGVSGTWKDLTESVNSMADNLTAQVRNIADVTTAVAKGDLSRKITVDVKGEILELKNTINTMVDQLSSFASEVTRVAREVGTEGKLGGQARVEGVSGTWKDLTDNVNSMAGNLTAQVRNIANVTTAVANGDLSKKITVDVQGEILELKNTINTMVDQLSSFASEVTRVAREVGTEGKLGGQARVKGVGGTWKDLTDSVNYMAGNLTAQVRNIAEVTTAVATGDLSKKITVDVKGEILELKNTINTMVDQLGSFADEVTRVAREVGTEGKLGGQADVKGVSGTWKDLTDSVNYMASNLTSQVRNIAEVTTAVATGDLSKKITVDVRGEILELKDTINTMVDQLGSFAAEVTRVAKEVGTEGKLGGQADVKEVSGTWRDLTDSVNYMAGNLTAQVRNIADVTTAVANGDLSKKITVDVKGEILELKNTINTMVDQLSSFASEVTRVAREVGTEGNLGGQAHVKGVSGTWKDLTDNVNSMAGNLTSQVRNIADVTTAVANGDLSKKITVDVKGEILELKNTINTMVDQLSSFASEVTRVAREVGTEGKLGGQARVKGVSGTWKDLTDSVNSMANNLTAQVRNIAEVTTAVANGNLSRKITVDVQGEILELKNTINTMVDQLSSFASEVTRVAREVGSEGKLGGQALVPGVGGIWKDLTDNVNSMAGNLTGQVRGIAVVVTAVANGNLDQKLVLQAKGEIAALADTINSMIDTLAIFADQVTSVAREVGVEGKLGGQARVPGAAGTWRDLTDNVNQLAANLTTQVRAIADVATAVTKGDLTRSISVEAMGEVAALKDNINEMIRNLKDTTQKNTEQDWLKTNLTKFTRMLQGQRDLLTVANLILSELAPLVSAQHGVFYLNVEENADEQLVLLGGYAVDKTQADRFRLGEGLVGQCAVDMQRILLRAVPDSYIKINSGLGTGAPKNIVVLPILFEGKVRAVIELASVQEFSDTHVALLDQLAESIGIVLNTIEANSRTENLLVQSQSLAEELQQTNQELEEKAQLLVAQNKEVEDKNIEIETARLSLQEKAEQLALTSRYKSEFLANMSHELRTPLNSLLILSQLLAENEEGNLSETQVEFAQTVFDAGTELLALINDILDLSRIESGVMAVDLNYVVLEDVIDDLERNFRQIAGNKNIAFAIDVSAQAPKKLFTDGKRLTQVLKNLLSNAFKFTEQGSVRLTVARAFGGWDAGVVSLQQASEVVAFSISDTGIGIPESKHKIVFEAFQQADGTTSRKYGGTGLGLAISREIANILGGQLVLNSVPNEGSTFTFYLPVPEPAIKESAPDMESTLIMTLPDLQNQAQSQRLSLAKKREGRLQDPESNIKDDRDDVLPGDKALLIVEDDVHFARALLERAHKLDFKGIVTGYAETAFHLAKKYRPKVITLDISLADTNGWSLLDRLKHDNDTRHIPVQIISVDEQQKRGMQLGAFGYLMKPVSSQKLGLALDRAHRVASEKQRYVLFYEPLEARHAPISEAVQHKNIHCQFATTIDALYDAMDQREFDCFVLKVEPGAPVTASLIESLDQRRTGVPILLMSDEPMSEAQSSQLTGLSHNALLKEVNTPEQLLDALILALHLVHGELSAEQQSQITTSSRQSTFLANRKIMVVDDDARNIYAIKSILSRQAMNVIYAENGQLAIDLLLENPDVECILMDIMMPVLDGYETTRAIRKLPQFKDLPIIALTAKAMKGDREKCLEAGASDYIAKPINSEQILAMLRAWMIKGESSKSAEGAGR
ncbi:MAG: HAMP domain-containing protein [Cyanobacteria bacterium SZAS TMP-1]|nr:HAMP domain-containing protein [Cyanobacteria bacterium SZAS TMP-1]